MKRTCTIRIQDEVNCVITNLHPDHVAYLYEEFSRYAPNYYFNPKYKLGQWDGQIRYFHKTGKTYVNLLDDIVPKLIGLEYTPTIDDQRSGKIVEPDLIDQDFFSHIIDPKSNEPWLMRPYQVDMVNALIKSCGGIGIAGTGSGKTSMCAALAKSFEQAGNIRSIIIVPDKNLTSQTHREYSFFGLDVGEYSGERKDLNHQHLVSTWQSLQNNPTVLQDFDMVINDECHGAKGQVLQKLLVDHGSHIKYRFGVTGTLPKAETDAMSVKIALGHVQYTIPAHQLINQGYLANVHIDILQLETDLEKQYEEELKEPSYEGKPPTYRQFKDNYFPDWPSEKAFLQSEKQRLEWIADYIETKRDNKKGNVLCLVNGVNFGKKMASQIEDAYFVHGKDKTQARQEIYQLFNDQDNIVVIATVNIASTGLDIPRVFHLMYIDVGKSFIRTIQSIGRGLRKAHDKESVHVSDICSDLKYSRRHLNERIKYYKEACYPHKKHTIDYTKV